ncbi:MAG: hypothetical protein U9Q67_00350 [Patescibacteria group bacterium]|nr:hypothetical protein [Patescibacteria group bacterium]
MVQNQQSNTTLPDEILEDLESLEYFILEELEDEESPIRKYVLSAITRIVLENSTAKERKQFKQWIIKDDENAVDWVLEKAVLYREQIYKELSNFFESAKRKAVYGRD